MTEPAYYNEFDPQAAQWLRNLIAAGEIAPGIVDDRSITDVRAADLVGFRQCHFFAGRESPLHRHLGGNRMTYGINEPRTGKPANGYPSFCWHCGKQLNWLRDETVDYETVRDWGGAEHRVHVTLL